MDIDSLQLADRTVWDDDQFVELYVAVRAEYERRVRMTQQDNDLAQIVSDNAAEAGRTDGDPWVQPTSVVDSYLEGAVVTHDGKTWVSTVNFNTWVPGENGWREQVEEGEAPAEWRQTTAGLDAYQLGDRVTFEGHVYESVFDGDNTWSPTAYPQAWKLVE